MRIAVLNGGTSLEREVSLTSGSQVTAALTDRGHEVNRLDVDASLVQHLEAFDPDVAFLALHGSSGEDGTIQSLLQLLDVPHTGPSALASALAWDKVTTKGLAARAGLAVPDGVVLSRAAFRELGAARTLDDVIGQLGLPLIVKPVTGGSSLGLTTVNERALLPAAIITAFSHADRVLVEAAVTGTELAVTVLDGTTLPAVEIVPRTGAYDFSARYTAGATEFHAPARLKTDVRAAAESAALAVAEALGATSFCRVDMIVTSAGVPTVLEVDTSPGLTPTSLVPIAARAADLAFGGLCEQLAVSAVDTTRT